MVVIVMFFLFPDECNLVTYELYDGYDVVAPNEGGTSSDLHYSVSSLVECLDLCTNQNKCSGVTFNGHTCRQHLNEHVDDDDRRPSPPSVLSTSAPSTFPIYAHKICIEGKYCFL